MTRTHVRLHHHPSPAHCRAAPPGRPLSIQAQRAQAEREVTDALAALERLRRAAEWKSVGKTAAAFWQDKFD